MKCWCSLKQVFRNVFTFATDLNCYIYDSVILVDLSKMWTQVPLV